MSEMNVNHVNMISYEGTQKQISLYIALSWFHMHKLHPGCIFGHLNGVLRICTRVQICSYFRGGANLFAPGCKFAPTFEVEQIYLHPGANCEYERKICIFYTFDRRF